MNTDSYLPTAGSSESEPPGPLSQIELLTYIVIFDVFDIRTLVTLERPGPVILVVCHLSSQRGLGQKVSSGDITTGLRSREKVDRKPSS